MNVIYDRETQQMTDEKAVEAIKPFVFRIFCYLSFHSRHSAQIDKMGSRAF